MLSLWHSRAQTNITSILATDVKIGEDDQTKIDFETADEIHFYAQGCRTSICIRWSIWSTNR